MATVENVAHSLHAIRRALVLLLATAAIVASVAFVGAWLAPPTNAPSPTGTVDLSPITTSRFESTTQMRLAPAPDESPLCSAPGPHWLGDALRARVGDCPVPVDELSPPPPAGRVLGAHLVRLAEYYDPAPTGPKHVSYPPLIWIVFLSGREAAGDYFTSIYDARSGILLLYFVIYMPPAGAVVDATGARIAPTPERPR